MFHSRRPPAALAIALAIALALAITTAACATGAGGAGTPTKRLRLGYFGNITHATALVGIEKGFFQEALGPAIALRPAPFSSGTEVVEALFGGAVDAAFMGPNPTINAFAKSDGKALRIVAGATSGGVALVVQPSISSARDLQGKTVASPQLGNTQDVALRAWLTAQGFKITTSGAGDVSVVAQENADTFTAFRAGDIDGAWVPEPWVTRLVQEAGGKVLVDERTLWPDGKFVITHLVVRTEFLRHNRDAVRRLLEAHVRATAFVNENPAEARHLASEGMKHVTGKRLPDEVVEQAWRTLTFTLDPLAASLAKSAADAHKVGLLDKVNLNGIYDLSLLNGILAGAGRPEVQGL